MVDAVTIARGLHALFAAVWLGYTLFLTFVFAPAIRSAGPEGGKVTRSALKDGPLLPTLIGSSTLTIMLGMYLYSALRIWELPSDSSYVMGVNIAVVLGLIAYAVALIVTFPASLKLRRLEPGPQSAAAAQALQKRLGVGGMAISVLLSVAFLLMVIAPGL